MVPDPQVGPERVHEYERARLMGIFVPEMKHLVIEQAKGHGAILAAPAGYV